MSSDNVVWIQRQANGDIVIGPEPNPSINDARHLYEALKGVLAAGRDCVFDAQRIERVDTAILQLLVAFAREAKQRGVAVHWENPSPALRQAAALLDLDGHLGLAAG